VNDNNYIPGLIETLLGAIDNCDWEALSELLGDDTVYEVSGFPHFEGKHAVMNYYENIRPIDAGHHTIDSIVSEGDEAVCCGRFVGTKRDGNVVDVLFADKLQFVNFKIEKRRVYFCQPE
jgi:ketosteroid isomerase-like protein